MIEIYYSLGGILRLSICGACNKLVHMLTEDGCWGCVACLVAGGFAPAMFKTCNSHFIFTQRCFVTDCRWLCDVISIYWPLYVSDGSWTWLELAMID